MNTYVCNAVYLSLDLECYLPASILSLFLSLCVRVREETLKEECTFGSSFAQKYCFQRTSNAVTWMGSFFCIICFTKRLSNLHSIHPSTHTRPSIHSTFIYCLKTSFIYSFPPLGWFSSFGFNVVFFIFVKAMQFVSSCN